MLILMNDQPEAFHTGFFITKDDLAKIPNHMFIKKAYDFDYCLLGNKEEVELLKSLGVDEKDLHSDYFGLKLIKVVVLTNSQAYLLDLFKSIKIQTGEEPFTHALEPCEYNVNDVVLVRYNIIHAKLCRVTSIQICEKDESGYDIPYYNVNIAIDNTI